MSAAGDLPKLDHIVFAAGIPLHVVTAGSLEQALLADAPTSHNPTPPAHVVNPDGTKGRINAYRCSYDYKRRIIEQKVKQLCGGRGDWKRANVEQWIGFSLDETARMKPAEMCRCGHKRIGQTRNRVTAVVHDPMCSKCSCEGFSPWQVNRWPLIELGMKRDDTIRWFATNGHPTPPRSACWFCPNSGNERWQALKLSKPDLFERACHIDDTIRGGGGFNARGNVAFAGTLYLHRSRIPLRDADLRTAAQVVADSGQGSLFDDDVLAFDCTAGVCFT